MAPCCEAPSSCQLAHQNCHHRGQLGLFNRFSVQDSKAAPCQNHNDLASGCEVARFCLFHWYIWTGELYTIRPACLACSRLAAAINACVWHGQASNGQATYSCPRKCRILQRHPGLLSATTGACAADAPESPETPAHNQEHISFPNNQSAIAFPEQEKLLEEYGRGIASVSYSLAQPQPQPQPQPQTRPQSVVRADLSTQNSAAASSLLQRRFQEFQQTQPTIMRQELAPSSPARPAPGSSFCTLSSGTLAAGTTQPVAILPCARPDCRTIKAIAQAMRVKLKESEEEVRILQNELRTTPHETKRRAGDNELMACLH